MRKIKKTGIGYVMALLMLSGLTTNLFAGTCSSKLFSVTIDSKLTVGDVIDNLADTCGLTVLVKDDAAKKE